MESEWPSKVEKWLSEESQWLINKLWQVVVEVEAERALLGRSRFPIPLKRFKDKKQDLETIRKILINLDAKGFLTVGRILTPKGQRTAGFVEEPIESDEEVIFYDPSTEISLTHGFKYLYAWLEKRQHPADISSQASQILNQFTQANLELILKVLREVRGSIEFSTNGNASYEMQSDFASAGAVREKQLIKKLETLELFGYVGEDIVTNLVSLDNLNLPLIDKCIEIGEQRLSSKVDPRSIGELERDIPENNSDLEKTPIQNDFNWVPSLDEKRGSLTLPGNNSPLVFWGGTFGGVNELIKNIGHDCKRQQLRESFVKCKQGRSKSAKEVNISKWLSGLKRKRPEFFKYFKVEYYPPDNYRLLYIHPKSN